MMIKTPHGTDNMQFSHHLQRAGRRKGYRGDYVSQMGAKRGFLQLTFSMVPLLTPMVRFFTSRMALVRSEGSRMELPIILSVMCETEGRETRDGEGGYEQ